MPAAHIAPATAMRVTPATNIAVANRIVLTQSLCMEHLDCWTGVHRMIGELEGSFWAA